MNASEHALRFACRDHWLVGVLHAPDQPLARGVLVITAGAQYRAGSHRQQVLLGRHLAARGVAVMRFDWRGMGDSDGAARTFDQIGDDVRAAVGHFFAALPALRELVLWGLGDAATAAALHGAGDRRITGLVLLNPWVRSAAVPVPATAGTKPRHWRRFFTPSYWRALAAGVVSSRDGRLPERLYRALARFDGRILIILSGADVVAREFDALPARHPRWRALLANGRVTRATIGDADHSCARKTWRDRAAAITAMWLAAW